MIAIPSIGTLNTLCLVTSDPQRFAVGKTERAADICCQEEAPSTMRPKLVGTAVLLPKPEVAHRSISERDCFDGGCKVAFV